MMGRRGRRRSFLCEWLISVSWAEWQSISSCKDFCVSALCLHPVLCVGSFTSCHPPIVGWKKKTPVFFFFLSDSHTILVLLHPFIKTNDYTLGTAVMGLQQQLDSGFCRWHLLQSTWFHFTLSFFFFLPSRCFFSVLFYNRKAMNVLNSLDP